MTNARLGIVVAILGLGLGTAFAADKPPAGPVAAPAATGVQPIPAVTPAKPRLTKEARMALRDACKADVETLCKGVEPGEGRIRKCMRENREKLSVGCKSAIMAVRQARAGAAQ